jgi:hypothetical protein
VSIGDYVLSGGDGNYSRDLRLAKWGSEVSVHGSIPEPLMSALGQKQTSRLVRVMSALPQKRTLVTGVGMSALCQKRTYAVQQFAIYWSKY